MKKIMALIGLGIVLINFSQVSAQLYLGGSVNINQDNYTAELSENNKYESSQMYVSILPQLGYYINNNLMIGSAIGYYRNLSEYTDYSFDEKFVEDYNSSYKRSGFSFKPFIQYDYTLSEKFLLSNRLGLSISTQKNENEFDNTGAYEYLRYSEIDGYTYGIFWKPSIGYLITDHLRIEMSFINLSYENSKSEGENWTEYENQSGKEDIQPIRNKSSILNFDFNTLSLGIGYTF